MTLGQFSPEASEALYKEILKSLEDGGISIGDPKGDPKNLPPKPFVFVALARTREFVGRAEWPEYRIHPKPRRQCGVDVYLVFSHPRIEEILGDIRDCLKAAAIYTCLYTNRFRNREQIMWRVEKTIR